MILYNNETEQFHASSISKYIASAEFLPKTFNLFPPKLIFHHYSSDTYFKTKLASHRYFPSKESYCM